MVVPVIDLQLRLNIKKEETSQNNNKEASQDKNRIIIIVELENLTAGMMVEEVKQIKELNGEEIENLPSLAQKIDREYIAGVGRTEEEELLMILDLESVLTREEMNQIQELEDNVVNE
jgi:purine-binding chemotaxis protein CheW